MQVESCVFVLLHCCLTRSDSICVTSGEKQRYTLYTTCKNITLRISLSFILSRVVTYNCLSVCIYVSLTMSVHETMVSLAYVRTIYLWNVNQIVWKYETV